MTRRGGPSKYLPYDESRTRMNVPRPAHRLSVRAVLLSLVVGLLSMTLVVGTPLQAQAATAYGNVSTAKTAASSGVYWLNCTTNAAKASDGSQSWIRFTSNCDRNALLAGEMATQVGTSTLTVTMRFTGSTDSGAACTYVGSWTGVDSAGNQSSTPNVPDCHVGQICEDWHLSEHFLPDPDATESCETMNLAEPGPTGPTTSGCQFLAGAAAEPKLSGQPFQDSSGRWRQNYTVDINEVGGRDASNGPRWVLYAVQNYGGKYVTTRLGPGIAQNYGMSESPSVSATRLDPATFTLGNVADVSYGDNSWNGQNGYTLAVDNPIIGYGYYEIWGGSGSPQTFSNSQRVAQDWSDGALGIADPSRCSFYWGVKISDIAGNTDEPYPMTNGATSTPAPDTSAGTSSAAGCGFSVLDPSTYAGAGICELTKLIGALGQALGAIASAIGHLAADIVGGIFSRLGDALSTLFVPPNAPSFSDVHLSVPTGWVPTMPSLGDSSCGPVTLPSLNLGHLGGTTAPATLLDTCAAPWPNVRTFSYYGLLALALVVMVRNTFRMLLASVGMAVESVGGGDDE